MKKIVLFTLTAFLFLSTTAFAGSDLPKTLAGITLGKDLSNYSQLCDIQHASPMPDAPFLKEVHLKRDAISGVRGGSLTFGNCEQNGKLVRIKMKFHDRRMKFFQKLLDEYTEAFGEPNSYKGDTFRNVIAWEWVFTKNGERVTLMLMWSRDREIRPGVSIKMTYSSLFDTEYECFRKKFAKEDAKHGGPSTIEHIGDFLPR